MERARLLEEVLRALKDGGQEPCILHDYQDFPSRIDSDIDAIVPAPLAVPRLAARIDQVSVVQAIRHEATAYAFVLCRMEQGRPVCLTLDVSSDFRRNGRTFIEGRSFLAGARPFKSFKVPPPALEFAYYLVKKIEKRALDEDQAAQLTELYRQDPEGAGKAIAPFFARADAAAIEAAAGCGDWAPVRQQMGRLRDAMFRRLWRTSPGSVLRYWLGDLVRRLDRLCNPAGLSVAFLGIDGSGKSSVIAQVEGQLADIFTGSVRYHLFPTKKSNAPTSDPHAKPLRGPLTSALKLLHWLGVYTCGHVARVLPHKLRPHLVLFDRYYHDLLADPVRYRYGGPAWLGRAVAALIPGPDLFIFLDAPPEVLCERKNEVSLEAAGRLREQYLKVVAKLPNAHVIDASRPLDTVVAAAVQAVVRHMAARTGRRLGLGQEAVK